MTTRARKRFGQNFLTDVHIIERIISTIDPVRDEPIIEIGPGRGAITAPLIAAGADLHVIEIDRDLAAVLPRTIPGLTSEKIHVTDALKADIPDLLDELPEGGIRVVGNLPYNISTPLLAHLMGFTDSIRDMHFMLQSEVVARMAAGPGSRTYGRLSIMCQYHCSIAPLFTVPPEAFEPVPRVDSAFVRLVPHSKPPIEVPDHSLFQRVVTQAFSQRRKTLRNSMKKMMTSEQIEQAGIDPSLRPEVLSMEDYASLTRVMAHYVHED
ncbi:MAG TPA: 16S rRNA (adenine(1518)-N(6)/adenine(1519)-N(6))-dimethyltransferase RsmA [Xanthomonadales bacterium]|nr:16S rRNA (adenine(1518)-N(6)/adenine(1519)-N(6))-dimethyltransferase RsmA [Xanthomonadales bacterium]